MKKTASLIASLCTFIFFCMPATAAAQNEDDTISYAVKSGDTLIKLGKSYLRNPADYSIVQRNNGIANPRRLTVGKSIRISRSLLKFTPSNARIAAVRGNVQLSGSQAAKGGTANEGALLKTGASSYVTLLLEDNSTIAIPSNSAVKITKLRKYLLGGSLDYEFTVSSGGASSKVRPHKSIDDRYRIRSPKAVSAVRGTEFQVRYDETSGNDFAEVVEGALAVDTGAASKTELPVGVGLAVASNGSLTKESLLAPPTLIDAGKTQSKKLMKFVASPASGEAGYRLTWATDAGFIDSVADITSSSPVVTIDGLENGNYFLRARAISPIGIQGLPVTFAFRRRLNDIQGAAGKGADGFNFKWASAGSGVQRFHFQLHYRSKDSVAMIDETGLTEQQVTISDLPPGEYFWRVGSVLFLDGEATTDWTDFEKLTISE